MKQTLPKLVDVARIAGVSTATVSRVLNDPSVVSESTRNAVLEAVKKTGYRVNRAARNLRTNTSKTILALVPNISNPFFSNILSGLERELSAADYNLLLSDSGDGPMTTEQIQGFVAAGHADGLIVLDGSIALSDLEDTQAVFPNCPIVFVCEWVHGFKGHSVRSDNAGGIRVLVDHLWELGHRRFGHLAGPSSNILSHERREGFEARLSELKGEVRPDWIVQCDFSIAGGLSAAEVVKDLKDGPTAWICASDQLAFGLISGLTRAGLRVPLEISVTGFDNIEMAEVFNPPLTTIHQHRNKLGHKAARCLLDQIAQTSDTSDGDVHTLPVFLVARESTGPVFQA
ncbi:LacI family DNA-binding transcriptional regulator [Shimia sp.]|uniref:LacI family DNA-binding transcriptional regulator n=1 Tax=Shimia sp. TaxID=1954381 RepID=UPI003BA86C83